MPPSFRGSALITCGLSSANIRKDFDNQKKKPIELAMDKEYGNIVTYEWFGDGYIAIGFTKGYISIVSSHMDEVKNEVK